MSDTPMAINPAPRKTFRATQFELREEAILDATNRLLSEKGFEAMAMDDIAAEVGVAKGSLYKHFQSKEALAGAVMSRLLRQTREALGALDAGLSAVDKLRTLLEWTLHQRLQGAVPHLPSTSKALQASLMANGPYVDQVMRLSESIGELILQAKRDGAIDAGLGDELVLYTLYARTCDPTLDYLKAGGTMRDEDIVAQLARCCFEGLGPGPEARPAARPASPSR